MTTLTRTSTPAAARTRAPRPALAAALLALFMSGTGAYGAIYFTGLEGWEDMGLTFLVTYEFVSITGLASAVAMIQGFRLGLVGVLWYAAFQLVFTAFKLAAIQEVEAIPFGVVAAVVLVLATRPSVRAYATR